MAMRQGCERTTNRRRCGLTLLEMIIAQLARPNFKGDRRPCEESPRAFEMLLEFALNLAVRCEGIEDHTDFLTHPLKDNLGLLGV